MLHNDFCVYLLSMKNVTEEGRFLILKNALIKDPDSAFHNKKAHVWLREGRIEKILDAGEALGLQKSYRVLDSEGLLLSPGWVDMRATLSEPGFEFKESANNFCLAAAKGGFTDVLVMPDTKPIIQHKADIRYIKSLADSTPVRLHVCAALSRDLEGREMTEMYDLHSGGALAFGDGNRTTWNAALLMKALQYTQAFGALVIDFPQDISLSEDGQMNEGVQSTYLGMKGIPHLAEELSVERNLKILRYTGGRMHFSGLSTRLGIDAVRKAKSEGLNITADACSLGLSFLDSDLQDFDTNLKVSPPLRTEDDRKAILEAAKDGTIDTFVSNHHAQEEDAKKLEFDLAAHGALNLQTSFSSINNHSEALGGLDRVLEMLTRKPRKILGLPSATIRTGEKACLTLFSPTESGAFRASDIPSSAKNSPFVGKTLKGRVIGVFSDKHHQLFEDLPFEHSSEAL